MSKFFREDSKYLIIIEMVKNNNVYFWIIFLGMFQNKKQKSNIIKAKSQFVCLQIKPFCQYCQKDTKST